MTTLTYSVPGIHCMRRTYTIEMEMKRMPVNLAFFLLNGLLDGLY